MYAIEVGLFVVAVVFLFVEGCLWLNKKWQEMRQ